MSFNYKPTNHPENGDKISDRVVHEEDDFATTLLKEHAFAKIYRALYDGQSSFLKSGYYLGVPQRDLTFDLIKQRAETNPHSRTAKAFELANIYYENCTEQNIELCVEIYKYAFAHSNWLADSNISGSHFFSSKNLNKHLERLEILQLPEIRENDNTRTSKIVNALRGR